MQKYLLLFLLFIPAFSQAQFLHVSEIDKEHYPVISARLVAIDANGNTITGYTADELSITALGEEQDILEIECVEEEVREPVSIVMAMDVSGSMSGLNMDMAKQAAEIFIKMTPFETTECALLSFDDDVYMLSDFTRNHRLLRSRIQGLSAGGGTNYNVAFLDRSLGAMRTAKDGLYKRSVIFLSDGLSTADEAAISRLAEDSETTVYSVLIGLDAPEDLKKISNKSGGLYFERVSSVQQAIEIYAFILQHIVSPNYCTVKWRTEYQCDSIQTFRFDVRGIQGTAHIPLEPEQIMGLDIRPPYIGFGGIEPGETVSRQFIVRAKGRSSEVQFNYEFPEVFEIRNHEESYNLQVGQEYKFTFDFSPTDSTFYQNCITISTEHCRDRQLYAYGGFYHTGLSEYASPVKITYPNGGEVLPAGIDTVIRWEGIDRNDWVELSYSNDAGNTWEVIGHANGLQYQWKTPPEVGSDYMVRARQAPPITDMAVFPPPFFYNPDQNFFTPNSRRLLVMKRDRLTINELNINQNHVIAELPLEKITCVAPGDQSTLYAAGNRNGTIKIWWPTHSLVANKTLKRRHAVTTLDFNSDETRLLSGHRRHAYVWNIDNGNKEVKLRHSGKVDFAEYTQNNERIVTATSSRIYLWDTQSTTFSLFGGQTYEQLLELKGRLPQVNQQTNTLTFSLGKQLFVVDIDTHDTLQVFNHSASVKKYAVSRDGNVIATYNNAGEITIWDVPTGQQMYFMRSTRESRQITSLALDHAGTKLIAGDAMGRAILWDLRTGSVLWAKVIVENEDDPTASRERYSVNHISVSPDNNYFYVYGHQGKGFLLSSFDLNMMPSDASDQTFALIRGKPRLTDVVFPASYVGQSIETYVPDFYTNIFDFPIPVDSLTITGLHADAFGLVSGKPPYTILSGGSRPAEFGFTPEKEGASYATVTVYSAGDSTRCRLIGVGLEMNFQLGPDVNMGRIPLRESTEKSFPVITNKGTEPLEIDHIELQDMTGDQFILEGEMQNIALQPNETLSLKGIYTGKYRGRASAIVKVFIKDIDTPQRLNLYAEAHGPRIVTLHCHTYDKDKHAVPETKVTCYDMVSGRIANQWVTDANGNFSSQIGVGRSYLLVFEKENYLTMSVPIDLSGAVTEQTIRREVLMPTYEVGSKLIMGDVLFDVDKATLRPETMRILDELIKLLNKYPDMIFEIGGHTDDSGDEAHNMQLSKRRAQAVFRYLKSKGIATNRMTTKGYGESQPMESNATEEGRQLNRRIELTILKI